MIIYEPRNSIYVDTPKGRGRIWLVTEYGMETQKLFTCIVNHEVWEFTNDQVRVAPNPTVEGFKKPDKTIGFPVIIPKD